MITFSVFSMLIFLNYQFSGQLEVKITESDVCKVMMPSIGESYDGDCKKGLADGNGTAKGIDSYKGAFKKGLPHGNGTYTWANGDNYIGEWKNGMKEGQGKLTKSDGMVITGYWIKDEYIGVDKQPYQVIQQGADILRVNFRKAADAGNKMEMKFVQNHAELPVRITQVNGGFSVIPANTSNFMFIVPIVDFPFQGHLQFDVPGNLSNTVISNVDLAFRISQAGSWVVTIEMRASN